MATIRMSGGQTFDVSETYETIQALVASGWTGTASMTDRSTSVAFTVKVPNIVAVQQ